jgi:hypothetical protein
MVKPISGLRKISYIGSIVDFLISGYASSPVKSILKIKQLHILNQAGLDKLRSGELQWIK